MSTQKNEYNPETELKPCPFCGGGASYHSRFDVKCGVCGAEINSLNPTETWNRRITPPTDTTNMVDGVWTDGKPLGDSVADTTGSGREGETPETERATKYQVRVYPHQNGTIETVRVELAKQLERQRDAALKALSDIEAHWRDQSNNPLWSQEGREICQMVADEISKRRAAIDSAQRQEGSKAE